MIGKYVIVRSRSAGVFAGTLSAKEGMEVTLKDARKLWHWSGASETLQLAAEGVKNPGERCDCSIEKAASGVANTESGTGKSPSLF